jgi:hypothetical protein
MGRFSASDAALEGFQVLKAHWRVVLGWCLFSVLGFVGLLVVASIAIFVATLAAQSRAQAAMFGGAVGGFTFGAGALAIEVMVTAALYRMLLRPGDAPGIFHLRLARDEGRLFVLWLLLLILFGGLLGVGYLAVSWLAPLSGLAAGVAALALAVAVLWLALRLSLAGPATFATRRLGIGASWRVTRGHVWALAGMTLLAVCLLALIGVVLWIATFLLQAAIGGFQSFAPISLADPQAFAERPGAYVFGMVAQLVVGPVFWVIGQTPFVAAYKALSAEA